MSKIKLGIVAIAAVFVISAVASSAASAATAGWMVGGTNLATTAALANTAKVDKVGTLTAAGITITCEGEELKGLNPVISAPNMGLASSLEFTECKVTTGSATCSTDNKVIKSVPLLAEVTLDGTGAKATFLPETKSTFATIQFLGASCALLGVQPVTGKAVVKAPTGQTESASQLIELSTSESSLKVGSSAATLEGSALLKLASGENWSFL